MKLYKNIFLFLIISTVTMYSSQVRADPASSGNSFTLAVHSENPSGLYWDSKVLVPNKPLLLSWRVANDAKQEAKIKVRWRILDAGGKNVQNGDKTYRVDGEGYIAGRQLFSPKQRGAYLWVVEARLKQDGKDIEKTAAIPFAVIAKPQFIGNPFLSVNTPAVPGLRQQNFLLQMGAKTWRSRLVNAQGISPVNLEAQLSWRELHGIKTVGVVQAPAENFDGWMAQVGSMRAAYPALQWEYSSPGDVSLSSLLESSPAMSMIDASEQDAFSAIALQGLWPEKVLLPPGFSQSLRLPVPDANLNSAARRRVILYAKKMARDVGASGFSLGDVDVSAGFIEPVSPRQSAAAMLQNIVLAHASAASGYSVSLNPQDKSFKQMLEFSSASGDEEQLIPWERTAVFAAATDILGPSHFVKELFSETPAVYAALFQANAGTTAVIWTAQKNEGRLKVKLPGARLLDMNGNQVDVANDNGNLEVPLTAQPYYVQAAVSPAELARALRAADIKSIPPVRAQLLPLTTPTGSKEDVALARELQVRLQNITPHTCSGVVTLNPPADWELQHASQQFVLKPGQWRVYSFKVDEARQNYRDRVRIKVRVNNGVTGSWDWKVQPQYAVASNWTPESTFKLDGSLDDWKDAVWMQAENQQHDRRAQLAVRWDDQYLYIAAKVKEPRFTARNDPSDVYRFWNGDAIQLGFGWRNEPWMQPDAAPFRDTDYGFIIAPFGQTSDGAIEARVLTLWNPTTPFAGTKDHLRWGGAVKGAISRISFDAEDKEAIYEAAIPLSALGDLNPASRSATTSALGQPIRFSWIAHTYDGVPVQWSEAIGVYPWWGNSGSFLPAGKAFFAAQGRLGFVQRGNVGSAQPSASPAVDASPPAPVLPPAEIKPQQPAPPKDQSPSAPKPPPPAPPQNQIPSLPFPVPVQPIPPNLLPPAPPEG